MGIFNRLLYDSIIRIEAGAARTTIGKHTRGLLSSISETCADRGIERGEIRFSGDGNVSFSSEIPEQHRQVLRNVIANN